jgi:hypothetical protein
MTTQFSFSKIENELLPGFRKKIGSAESTEDVKKFYVYTMQDLFRQAFSGNLNLEYGDIFLQPNHDQLFVLSERVKARADFVTIWKNSDLSHVITRFTETAINRSKHLEKNPAKTEAKIRM